MLPPDLLRRVAAGEIEGLRLQDFDLPEGEALNDAIGGAWRRLQERWKVFTVAREQLAADQPGAELTNRKWLLPLFDSLGYGKLITTPAPVIDEKTYPIARFWNKTPIHLVGCNVSLDRRTPGVKGAATHTPHGMAQEFLNRSDEHLWAFASNGLRLRILRDNATLSRRSYVEFDLEAMFEGGIFSDFVLLWLVCHRTRVETGNDSRPESCWLERWFQAARQQGMRVLEDLRAGVQKSIEALGSGFVSHPRNDRLRAQLRSGELSAQDFYRQVLGQVYRLLFLFVAEDRQLLHPPIKGALSEDARQKQTAAREEYDLHYSTGRLRDLAIEMRGSGHCDLWRALSLVYKALHGDAADAHVRNALALPELGSVLWDPASTPDLNGSADGDAAAHIADQDLLEAIRHLAFVERDKELRPVDYKDLSSEELGSVYESLLELHPEIDAKTRRFALRVAAGSERKTTGSYYTPDSLVRYLLESALEPVIEDRLQGLKTLQEREEAILNLKVCDPAVGSGHFLIAAAHRIAGHLARIRAATRGDAEPTPELYQHAVRDVICRCLYGVDINPMAAELCKVALWIESIYPGKPLSFLDHHIKVGNSLLGATPALMIQGIPDEAFKPLEGDHKEVVTYYKKRNKQERKDIAAGQKALRDELRDMSDLKPGNLPATLAALAADDADSAQSVADQARRHDEAARSSAYENAKLVADAWCAAFVWKMHDSDAPGVIEGCPGEWDAVTESVYRALEDNPRSVQPWIKEEIRHLAHKYQFFHWHLEFPEVFGWLEQPPAKGRLKRAHRRTGGHHGMSGFDAIVGNPPFLNQLETATTAGAGPAGILRRRSDDVIRGYTDLSAAFLLISTSIARAGGRVAFVQPQSLLAAKDAGPVRAAILCGGSLSSLWVSNERVFDGVSVFTCAPTIHVDGPRRGSLTRSATGAFTPLDAIEIDNDALAREETWAHLVAAASGVPEVAVRSERTIGDIADATADFRDQYYGLDGFLVEDSELSAEQRADMRAFPPIVTTGLIDLAECRWGDASTRILRRRWTAPRIDRRRMNAEGTLGGWITDRLVPKLLIATQTKVIEVCVDERGRFVPGIPIITVTPKDPSQLWHIAAAIASPVCSALALQKYAGAALSADAIKLSAKQVLRLPVPSPSPSWDAAADHIRAATNARDERTRPDALRAMGEASIAAFGAGADGKGHLLEWWWRRLGGSTPLDDDQ